MAGVPSIADEYAGYDTFQEAMLAHAGKRKQVGLAPQAWNPWLKEAAQIALEAGIPDAPSGAGVGNRQFSDIRKLVNSAVFGPDWQQQVFRDSPDAKRLEEAARAQKAGHVIPLLGGELPLLLLGLRLHQMRNRNKTPQQMFRNVFLLFLSGEMLAMMYMIF